MKTGKIEQFLKVAEKKGYDLDYDSAKRVLTLVEWFGYSIFDLAYDVLNEPKYKDLTYTD